MTILKTRPFDEDVRACGRRAEQASCAGVFEQAAVAGVGEVHGARGVGVVGDVLDADELEDVVGVGPVLERVLRLVGRRPVGDVRGNRDELARSRSSPGAISR